jgi:sugar/nucleoside kinase (ribokinase family)
MFVVIGISAVDKLFEAPSWPKSGERRVVPTFSRHIGGNGPNVAVGLGALLSKDSKPTSAVKLLAPFGPQENGSFLLDELDEYGIRIPNHLIGVGARTPQTIVRIPGDPDEEPSFIHVADANEDFCGDHLKDRRGNLLDPLTKCEYLHICGLGLMPRMEKDLPRILDEVRDANPDVIISADTNLLASDDADYCARIAKILTYVDIFMPNVYEASQIMSGISKQYGGILKKLDRQSRLDLDDINGLALGLMESTRVRRLVVVKLDRHGVFIQAKGPGKGQTHAKTQIVRRRAFDAHKVKFADGPRQFSNSLGAGDAWAAGFLCHLFMSSYEATKADEDRRRIVIEAADYGNACACHCVTTRSSTDWTRLEQSGRPKLMSYRMLSDFIQKYALKPDGKVDPRFRIQSHF